MITESDAVDQDLIDATNAIEDAYQKKIDEERLAYKYVRTEEEEMESCKSKHTYVNGVLDCEMCNIPGATIMTVKPSINACECQADPEKDYLLCKFCKGSMALFLRTIFQDLFQENVERFKSIPASKGLVIRPRKIEKKCICSMQTLMRNGCECEGK